MLFPIKSQPLAYLALIYFLFLPSNLVFSLPLRARQNGATTVQTVHTSQTPAGQLTETCIITLTPITDKNGQPAVEEVKKCSLVYDNASGGTGAPATTSGTTFTTSPTVGNTAPLSTETSTTISSIVTTSAPGSQSSTGSLSSSTTLSTSTATQTPIPTGTSSVPGSSSVTGTTVVSGVATSSGTSPTPASSSAPPVSGIKVNGITTVTGIPTQTQTTSPTATDPNGTTAADSSVNPSAATAAAAESTSDAAFQLPGKKLSVLPIGLGVFAGISVIALIVVGLVTYERTKYRKAFRQRKLAESGASMGYGGMAERS